LAYDRTGQFSLAIVDYMNTVQLMGNPKTIFGDVFYKWSQTYAALGRYRLRVKDALEAAASGLRGPTEVIILVPVHDGIHDPIEIIDGAARVFGVGGYMLGERLLHCLGLVVSVVDNDSQPFPRRRD
jgi:hypothetical protein